MPINEKHAPLDILTEAAHPTPDENASRKSDESISSAESFHHAFPYRTFILSISGFCVALLVLFAFVVAASNAPIAGHILPNSGTPATLPVTDKVIQTQPYKVIDEECYLDRWREFHMFCQVIPNENYNGEIGNATAPDKNGDGIPDVSEVKVDYVLYGYGIDKPFSSFSTWTDENGYINVVVDFSLLSNDIDDQHVIGSVDGLASYGISAVADIPVEHSISKHEGEPAHARDYWLYNDTWYRMDYRSYGTLESAARNSGRSPDPAVRERFSWRVSPQKVENDANANGTCNYWGNRNWIIVHDYSWMGQMWLTMCPGMTCWVDGVEYKVGGAFDIRKTHTDWDVWQIVPFETLILQTCDGAIYNRIIWIVPVDDEVDPEVLAASNNQARNYTW